ncbi:MAG: hypothetical protein JSR82_03345 [Verrucomicrobia bacterium]|nr:hypothetical protein [Verrucomicrobiota bacterium]
MNRTWKLVEKDLRQFRSAWLVWSGLVALEPLCAILLTSIGVSESAILLLPLLDWPLWLAQLLGGVFLGTVLVLQADAPTQPQAFWKCRPVSGGRLLRAKLLTLSLGFLVWPLLWRSAAWLWCGCSWHQMGWMALDVACVVVAIVLPAICLAVATRTLLQFILVGLAFGGTSLFILVGVLESSGRGEALSRLALVVAILLAGALPACFAAYLSRDPGRSLRVLGVAWLCLVAAVARWGPRSGEAEQMLKAVREGLNATLPKVNPADLRFRLVSAEMKQDHGEPSITVALEVIGFAERTGPAQLELGLRWPNADGSFSEVTLWSVERTDGEIVNIEDRGRSGAPEDVGVLRFWSTVSPEMAVSLQQQLTDVELTVRGTRVELHERSVRLQTWERSVRPGEGFRVSTWAHRTRFQLQRYCAISFTRFFLFGKLWLTDRRRLRVVDADGTQRWRLSPTDTLGVVAAGLVFEAGNLSRDRRSRDYLDSSQLVPGDRLMVSELREIEEFRLTARGAFPLKVVPQQK